MSAWAKALFEPARIALIGASPTQGKAGFVTLSNLLSDRAGFKGEVVPVHLKEQDILGRQTYLRVRDIPGGADLAVVVTPPVTLPAVMEDCAAAGVKTALVISSGFAETGSEGQALEQQMADVAREGGVRVVGPNCFGVINAHSGLNASIGLGIPGPGGISLITQSGAYGMAAFTRSIEDGIGFAKVASPGNKVDVNEVDFLRVLGKDSETRVIAMLIESFSDGRAFFDAARAITPNKPILVLKTGRGEAAKRAAASHTAALAGDNAIASAALEQAGVTLVRDGLALLDAAFALDRQGHLRGRRVGIVTNSGGTGVELADLLEEGGLLVPRLSDALQRQIAPLLAAFGSAQNPIDMTTDWKRYPEIYGKVMRTLLGSNEIDAVMLVLLQRSALMVEVTDRVIVELERARAQGNAKPVHVCWVAPSEADGNRAKLRAAGIPCEPWTDRAARSLIATLAPQTHDVPNLGRASKQPEKSAGSPWLASQQVFEQLEKAALPLAPWLIAHTSSEAAQAAVAIGFPVVMKAERPGLVHKSDAGGVILNLPDEAAVVRTFDAFASQLEPGPALIQAQAEPGLELIIGGYRDPQFGPVVMLGLGGVWVETLGDVALRLAPIDEAEARAMIGELKGAAVLDGLRGGATVDRDALASLVAGISCWFAAASWAQELDINPLIANEKSLQIVDARIRLDGC